MPFKPFTGKNDPRNGKSSGRKEHPLKGKVAMELWEAMVKFLRMPNAKAKEYIKSDKCKTHEKLAWEIITNHQLECFDKFCGRTPLKTEVTGGEGEPLMPERKELDFRGWTKSQVEQFLDKLEGK